VAAVVLRFSREPGVVAVAQSESLSLACRDYHAETEDKSKANANENNQSRYCGQRPLNHEYNHRSKTHLKIFDDDLHRLRAWQR